jgi:hypothetical protein
MPTHNRKSPTMTNWNYTLRKGHSDNPARGACAMDAVNWLVHGKHGDAPECACPIITKYVIAGNDAMPDDVRQRLIPYLHRIAGSRSAKHEAARLRVIVLGAVRVFVPLSLDAVGQRGRAATLREMPDDTNYETLRGAARAAADAARAAHAASYAAAAARADAAYAEDAAAYAGAYAAGDAAYAAAAASDAAYAAHAAAYAAAAHAARAAYAADHAARTAAAVFGAHSAAHAAAWQPYFDVLDTALNAGPQGEPWSADVVAVGEARFRAVAFA